MQPLAEAFRPDAIADGGWGRIRLAIDVELFDAPHAEVRAVAALVAGTVTTVLTRDAERLFVQCENGVEGWIDGAPRTKPARHPRLSLIGAALAALALILFMSVIFVRT